VLKYLIPAVFAAALLGGSAYAAPLPASSGLAAHDSGMIVQVGKKKWKKWNRGGYGRGHHYRGHHYRHPPRGWHRYHSRPYGWSRRGCIAIGPVWYCP
jgi:hypothetical protein